MHLHIGNDADHHHHHHHGAHRHGSPRLLRRVLGLIALGIVVGIALRCVYFVDETEYVYVTQFGEPLQLVTQPGLGWKWPYQSLHRFDRRLQMVEPPAREMLTEDKENLNFQWYACWRLPNRDFVSQRLAAADSGGLGPVDSVTLDSGTLDSDIVDRELETLIRRYLQSVGTRQAAESRLEERIQAAIAAEIGRTRLDQLVSLDPQQLRSDAVAERMLPALREIAAEQFGIELVDVRLKRFSYPAAVKPAVYAEIRSERERVAIQYRAEGASEKTKIESRADLQRDQLLAQAQREASRVRGEGQAKSIEILNAAHEASPEFYELLKTLETYQAILDEQTTLVLSADSPLLRLLTKGLPLAETPSE